MEFQLKTIIFSHENTDNQMGRNIMSLWAKGQETVRFNGTSVWLLLASNFCFLEILDIDSTSKYT
jgi:hypothetical protein